MKKGKIICCCAVLFTIVTISPKGFSRHLPLSHGPNRDPSCKEIPGRFFITADVETLHGPVCFEDGLPEAGNWSISNVNITGM